MDRTNAFEIWLNGHAQGFSVQAIDINAIPPGEAPIKVRERWVGLRLPLAQSEVLTFETASVLSPPKSRLGWWLAKRLGRLDAMTGYIVNASAAVDILEHASPDAAAWWRTNTPHLLDGVSNIMFPETLCRKVATALHPSSPANDR